MNHLVSLVFLLPLLIFLFQGNLKRITTLALIFSIALSTSYLAFQVLSSGIDMRLTIPLIGQFTLVFDNLSSFFILIINFIVITGALYSGSYLKQYAEKKPNISFSLHYVSLVLLHFSMILVCLAREGLLFITAWELMTISSFVLVAFDAENKSVLKTSINYLIQMHIGLIFILASFFWVEKQTGIFGFDGLSDYFLKYNNLPVFLLFFAGFGIKAGFTPFHTWLPEAHPAAPSHVSGIMSGVMIKLGLYGILRVCTFLHSDFTTIGIIILLISLHSGIYGIMLAILQRDIKRILAFSSIENIGIAGIGIGTGLIGLGESNMILIILGFTGALLHILNHSLFKSLLFYSAGTVYWATHTRNIEQLGGIIHKMPKNSIVFLIGILSLCAFPPFNGFVSEYLIFYGLFYGIQSSLPFHIILFITSIIGMALISGMAMFCFTRVFGLGFLGNPRTKYEAKETNFSMLLPKILTIILILSIGFLPTFFAKTVSNVVINSFTLNGNHIYSPVCFCSLNNIALVSGIFVLISTTIIVIRNLILKKRQTTLQPTWGCANPAVSEANQYTSTSYTSEYSKLTRPIIATVKEYEIITEDEIFPKKRKFKFRSIDRIKTNVVDKFSLSFVSSLRSLARLQTGYMQHYVLYALVFLIFMIIITFFNII